MDMDPNVTTSNHFWNLRPLRHYSERVTFVLSLFSNTVLAVLLVREKNEVMKPYSRVLLLNCLFDYVYTVACIVVEVEAEMIDGNYIFVVNGIPRNWSPNSQAIAVCCWMFALSLTGFVPPIEFIFRYSVVVRGIVLDGKWLLVLGALVVTLSFADFFLLLASFQAVRDQHEEFDQFMRVPMWSPDGILPAFVGTAKDSFYFQIFVANVAICDAFISLILVLTSVATLRKLAQLKPQMSASTKYLQSQMNRLMFAEALSLCVVSLIPNGAAMVMLYAQTDMVGLLMPFVILVTWIPTVNPLTTIFLVGSYRRAVFGKRFEQKRVRADCRVSTDAGELSIARKSKVSPYR